VPRGWGGDDWTHVPTILESEFLLRTLKSWYAGPTSQIAFQTSPHQVEGCTRALQDGEALTLGDDVHIRCLHTPGWVESSS